MPHHDTPEPTADYVIVGGGSAGCVLAGRLTAAGHDVLVLEAGPRDRHPLIHVPAGFARLPRRYAWQLATVPQAGCLDREVPLQQGRLIGGGGSINAQVFTRGLPSDFDTWAEEDGCTGWGSSDVAPYFIRSEGNARLGAPHHGTDGPLRISDVRSAHPLSEAFVRAGQEAGLPHNTDFNAGDQGGVGFYQTTTDDGRRCSTAVGYLSAARATGRLKVRTGTVVHRLLVEAGEVVGVELGRGSGAEVVRARREVLLTAGAVGSARLLLLSGIGDPTDLREAGVAVTVDLPGVGRNLQDHYCYEVVTKVRPSRSYDIHNRPLSGAGAVLRYLAGRRGPLASTVVEAGGFGWVGDEPEPAVQLAFLPAGREVDVDAVDAPLPPGSGCGLLSWTSRPRSRGRLWLRSADPTAPVAIDPRYLHDEYDVETGLAGIEQTRAILDQPAFAAFDAVEHFPGRTTKGREALIASLRRYGRTGYHLVGTCAMGDGDSSVVDPQLRVRGVTGLRVCDSSVMPRLVSSNTQATVVMIAERAADLLAAG